jgi:NADPH-dependent curcumin reductase CurA
VLLRQMLVKRLKMQGFIIFDHFDRRGDFLRDMSGWLGQEKLKYREEVLEGLERAPAGLIGMLRGDNFGKLVVKVADG